MTMQLPSAAARNRETGARLARLLPRLFAVFLVLHGLVHIIGFTNALGPGSPRGVEYSTRILNRSLEVGDAAVKALGFLWLAAAVAFVVVGVMVWRGHPRALGATIALLAGSLVLCTIGLPNAVMGLAIDVILLALLAVASDRLIVRPDERSLNLRRVDGVPRTTPTVDLPLARRNSSRNAGHAPMGQLTKGSWRRRADSNR